ncbi:SDR family oxidoreductase [Chitinophaga tropicalis]|uniref:SDR family NAD(P)-dependent oxidoreductase n=1 Tax=Chitinophaga tropicalis TaxID=2683588 RepID=A0A7K1U2P6_9BACT|nr:SDR family NAD(P)-dependent oxidoreductase [Chitinophaga tropicalis]MVT08556.1 SDR family NAD(P)-dependent oxidoreductase [Chitinophaga tropicalis]
MKTSNNTVLVTGGSAGIGYEIAKQLTEKGNHVIITGRNTERLQKAAAQLKNVTAIVSDVSKEEDVRSLVATLNKDFPSLNLVINNAGAAAIHNLAERTGAFEKAAGEIHTNYLSIIRLNELLLPLLEKQQEAAIVNVSSIVSFVPNHVLPGYSASKAALHSYTQALRFTLSNTSVKVFELMPPLVNTDFSQAIGGSKGIPPSAVADELVNALEKDHYEIHVGDTAAFYQLFLSSPADALKVLNTNE